MKAVDIRINFFLEDEIALIYIVKSLFCVLYSGVRIYGGDISENISE